MADVLGVGVLAQKQNKTKNQQQQQQQKNPTINLILRTPEMFLTNCLS